jgi:hypothetical protein
MVTTSDLTQKFERVNIEAQAKPAVIKAAEPRTRRGGRPRKPVTK